MTLIFSSAAEAAVTKTMKPMRIRRNGMHSSFDTRKGLGVDGSRRSPGFASEDGYSTSDKCRRPSRVYPSDRLRFPRLQLRGSAGFSPASLLVRSTRVHEPEKIWQRAELNGSRNLL